MLKLAGMKLKTYDRMIFVFDYMKVFTIQTNQLSRQFVEAYIRSNQLEDSVRVIDKSPEDLTSEDLLCKRVKNALCCILFSATFKYKQH